MGEWFYSQKKPSGNFRKLLKQQRDKANLSCTEFTAEEKKLLAKLEPVAEKLRRGKTFKTVS